MKVLICGVTGMLGHALFRVLLREYNALKVYGTARGPAGRGDAFLTHHAELILNTTDASTPESFADAIETLNPEVVINAVGIVKQSTAANDTVAAIRVNALFPHLLAQYCDAVGARLIHVSTDCVFSGRTGGYSEEDLPDPADFYGRTKLLGEVTRSPHVTIRTSIIGHELSSSPHGLVGWFLGQTTCKGYAKAVFSGFPTVELARIIADYILPDPELPSPLHISADPIDKYALLSLINGQYGHGATISRDEMVEVDRSLDSSKFREITGFTPPSWTDLVRTMHNDFLEMNRGE